MNYQTFPNQHITKREKQVLSLIAYEYSTKQIAAKLDVAYETAHTHRQNLLKKLEVANTAGMIRVAFEEGLLTIR
jgi:DNA-binding NarL/FixJ family response regulator